MSAKTPRKIRTSKKRQPVRKTTTRKRAQHVKSKVKVPTKNIRADSNINLINENTLLKNNFNKTSADLTSTKKSNEVLRNENTLLKNNFNKTSADLTSTKKSNEVLLHQNNSLLARITKLENIEKITKEKEIPKRTGEILTLKQKLQAVQKEKIQLQGKNTLFERKNKNALIRIEELERQLKKKGTIPAIQPVAKTEFTNIFKEIIENFNQQNIGGEDARMDYIISDMDVELKAQVSYNSKGKMVLGTPDIENIDKAKDSLSVMKFKIRPVPRTNAVKIQ